MYKIMAIDLDGTLLNDEKEMSIENIEWINRAYIEKGVLTVIATGRTIGSTQFYANMIGADIIKYVICQNGAVVRDIEKDQDIRVQLIDKETVKETVKILKDNNLQISMETDKYVLSDTEKTDDEIALIDKMGDDFKIIEDAVNHDITDERITIVTGVGKTEGLLNASKELEKFENIIVVPISTFLAKNGDFVYERQYIEFTAEGVTKGSGIRALLDYLQIKEEEILIMGDGRNDLPMFELDSVKIAMGNAEEEIKQKADYITTTNVENGVAKAIRKYIFNIEE